MKAMILAAGRGERMRPLTRHTPKAILKIQGQSLIAFHLKKLAQIGIKEVVINLHHFAEKIQIELGSGAQFGLRIHYSIEKELLETGGGIYNALPLLGQQPFLVISSDIFTEFPFEKLLTAISTQLAHLILVPNPDFHPQGDFSLAKKFSQSNFSTQYLLKQRDQQSYSYASFGILNPKIFDLRPPNKTVFRMTEILEPALRNNLLTGEVYQGLWHNLGTPKQLSSLEAELTNR